jgi:cation:H+ antiporter
MKKSLFFIALGIYGLYVGGELIVEYASLLAEMFGVSKVMIGASIVAIGTSVPELVTSVIAARHKQTDMAIGNII